MAGANIGFAGIVTEKLTEENYDNWKECLKSYFIANGLWDVVTGKEAKPEEGSEGYEEWMRKNAMALHAIQISSGADRMSKYRGNGSAKYKWDILAKKVRGPRLDGEDKQESLSLSEYRTFYKAVAKGDWDSTSDFLDKNPTAIRAKMTLNGSTVLHVAVIAGQTAILKKLLARSTIEDLELRNHMGYTAFLIAAINGFKDMVEAMLKRDENLIKIKEKHGLIPVVAASVACSTKVVRYLYPKTPREMLSPEHQDKSGATLLNSLIVDDIYDLALHLLETYPQLAFVEDLYGNYAIITLAQKRSAFPSGNNYVFWKQRIYSCIRVTPTLYDDDEYSGSNDEESGIRILLEPNTQQVVLKKLRGLVWKLLTWIVPDISNIYKRKSNHIEAQKILKSIINHIPSLSMEQFEKFGWDQAINDAIKNGISEFVDEVIESTPELIWKKDEKGRTIFANAIVQRQEDIFSRIYVLSANMHAIIQHDIFHNNFLHLAAKLSPSSRLNRISGAALQMQRELQWFEEMRSMLPPKYMEEVNDSNKTPSELFTEKHQVLVQEGERWMKNTAASCMVVATLIAAVMFTTAYTVPGGNDEKKGTPLFLKQDVFLIFVVSDALSLFSSCVSVLVFLGILTSRYAEKDFRKSLPTKLIVGLSSLFFSIVTMMASFGAAICLILQDRLRWVSYPIIVLCAIPIALYSSFQFPLLIEVIFDTYGVSIFDNKRKRQYAKKLKDLTET